MNISQSLTNSFFRQVRLLQILNSEHEYFLKHSGNSGVKNCLHRMKVCFENNMTTIFSYLTPESQLRVKEQMSVEKMEAMSNIIGLLVMMDDASVLELENQITQIVKIEPAT